ncbi:NAD(P)-dependent alcohol dehydrogenase [Alicyclobacillus shizuokensis]|uniref:NAD(P)-dependent alcohol dehydrogenase n=1 Tax=Alicyclobacillus shizuokensis TaxID=392014 RepID=UPI00146FE33F|nr:NAD(P)-dependent alcohol dehydrogenase [Alicyclobacillus shizuokensis]MCL6624958.1 NAD(P)-dependent alcohol dehydrogenase [Alicyclobacillus shizuokensis]
MKAAVLRAVEDLVIDDIPAPEAPAPGWVQVAVRAVGICGSDVHYYQEGAIGSFVLRQPMILGHEVGGVITAVGEGVDLPVGTVVALEPGIPCGKCPQCRQGRYNLCPDVQFFATPPVDGAMTERVNHPAAFTYPANGLTPEEASLAEPLSVGIAAVGKAALHLGERALILGAGPVGLLTALAADAEGAVVTLCDVQVDRLTVAEQLGFSTLVFDAQRDAAYDAVIDCSGSGQAVAWGQRVVRPGGRIILVGMGAAGAVQLDGLDLCLREVSVRGVFRYANTFPAAIELLRRRRDVLPVFTGHRIALAELPECLRTGSFRSHVKTLVIL